MSVYISSRRALLRVLKVTSCFRLHALTHVDVFKRLKSPVIINLALLYVVDSLLMVLCICSLVNSHAATLLFVGW